MRASPAPLLALAFGALALPCASCRSRLPVDHLPRLAPTPLPSAAAEPVTPAPMPVVPEPAPGAPAPQPPLPEPPPAAPPQPPPPPEPPAPPPAEPAPAAAARWRIEYFQISDG